jgi:hypothetical protein
VAGAANAEQLQVEATVLFNQLVVALAVSFYLLDGQRAVRNVHVFGPNVHVVEQLLVHEVDVALELVRLHGVVLVEVEGDHVLEAEAFLAVQADKLLVHANGRRAGGQTQYGLLALVLLGSDQLGNFVGHVNGALLRRFKNGDRQFFKRGFRVIQYFHG